MATVEITDESFRDIYKQNEVVVLDFWAIWCSPCHAFAPIYEEVSENSDFADVVFGKVDTESETKLSAYFGIRSIPTIMIVRQELEVFRSSGVMGKIDLQNLISEVKNADMDEIRAKIDAEER